MLWGPFVRFFHWSLAAGIVLNYWLLEAGETPHEWLGYALVTLVLARVGWGIRGPEERARFSRFIVGPRRILASLRNPAADYRRHEGHSPLGGWMVLCQLSLVLLIGVSGWMQELDAFWGEDWVELLHEYSAHVLIATVAVHVTAVLWIQYRYRQDLVRSMLWKRRV